MEYKKTEEDEEDTRARTGEFEHLDGVFLDMSPDRGYSLGWSQFGDVYFRPGIEESRL